MELNYDSDDIEPFGGTDLIDAIVRGNTEAVKVLLACPYIDVNLADEYGRTPLLIAAQKGRSKATKLLLACPSIVVNAQTCFGTTALMAACEYGRERIVRLMLACPKIDVNIQNEAGDTALTKTARGRQTEIIEMLLASPKTELNLLTKSGHNALDLAENSEMRKLLLAHVIAPPELQEHALSPAHSFLAAARYGYTERVKVFLKRAKAADVNYQDTNGNTALLNAVYCAQTDIVRMMLDFPGVDVNTPHKNGYSPLLVAAFDQPAVVKMLLAVPSININFQALENGQTALIRAVANGQSEIVKMLLAFPGVDVNLVQKNGYSALMVAAQGNNSFVKLLLDVPGIKVNLQGKCGQTALMVATYHTRLVIMRLLLARPEIQADLQDEEGKTALITASEGGSHQLAEMLLSSKLVDVNLATKTNLTAMSTAKNGRIKSLLRVYGAEPCVRRKKTSSSVTASIVAPARFETPNQRAPTTQDVLSASENTLTVTPFGTDDIVEVGGIIATSTTAYAPIMLTATTATTATTTTTTTTTTSSNASCTPSNTSLCTANPQVETEGACTGFFPTSSIDDMPAKQRPTSWLAARLRLSGMSENLVVDCEDKLVHTEGFSNVNDFAECPPSDFSRDYLSRIGITGLGTQRNLMRLHGELHNAFKQLPSSQLPQTDPFTHAVNMTADPVNHSENSTDTVAGITIDGSRTCCTSSNTDSTDSADSRKRSRTEAFECDHAVTEHAFVPPQLGKR